MKENRNDQCVKQDDTSSIIGKAIPFAIVISSMLIAGTPAKSDPPPNTGTITGVVRFTGKLPPAKKILTSDGSTLIHHDLVVDAKTKGLRYVFAVIENAKPQPKLKKAKPVLIDQQEMIFTPRVVAVQDGQPVWFTNSDLCNHSVMAISKIKANAFNVFTPNAEPFKTNFTLQKRPIIIGCSLHPWMRAWVYTVPHSWFAVTNKKGQFTITNIPPGQHTLHLQHRDTNTQQRLQVQVRANETTKVNLVWPTAAN